MPAGREGEPSEDCLGDGAGPVRPEQPVDQKKLSSARLRFACRFRAVEARALVVTKGLECGDGRVDRTVCRISISGHGAAVPATVDHLLFHAPVPSCSIRDSGAMEASTTIRAGSSAARPVYSAMVLSLLSWFAFDDRRVDQLARHVGLWMARQNAKATQEQHGIGGGSPLGCIYAVRPAAAGILQSEQTSAPTFSCDTPLMAANRGRRGANQVAQCLPADRRIAFQEPRHDRIGRHSPVILSEAVSRRAFRVDSGSRPDPGSPRAHNQPSCPAPGPH